MKFKDRGWLWLKPDWLKKLDLNTFRAFTIKAVVKPVNSYRKGEGKLNHRKS
jgi:hypothetical protein